jgi:SAM-dependent methyltransferase
MNRPDPAFMKEMELLQDVYLTSDDPIVQSGFSGGRERWVAERSPIVQAIDRDGDFLDVGCANGLLAEDVMQWAAERGHAVVPHGVDIGPELVQIARQRMPDFSSNFVAADAWSWQPARTWDYVYSLLDLAPDERVCSWLERLSGWVSPGGRLIIGSYGSRSRGITPVDVASVMGECELNVRGTSAGGDPPPISIFAWVEV